MFRIIGFNVTRCSSGCHDTKENFSTLSSRASTREYWRSEVLRHSSVQNQICTDSSTKRFSNIIMNRSRLHLKGSWRSILMNLCLKKKSELKSIGSRLNVEIRTIQIILKGKIRDWNNLECTKSSKKSQTEFLLLESALQLNINNHCYKLSV